MSGYTLKSFFLEVFTWWNGQTMGTRLFTARNGVRVGDDEYGNTYYQNKTGERRWVIYAGVAEASQIGPGWHGWMHHRTDVPPTKENYTPRSWQKPHQENLTGTAGAYRPHGSILGSDQRPTVTGDYDAWSPEA